MSFVRDSKFGEEASIASLTIGATAFSHVFITETDLALLSLSVLFCAVPLVLGLVRKVLIRSNFGAEAVSLIGTAAALAAGEFLLAASITLLSGICVTAYNAAANRRNSGVREIVDNLPYSLRTVGEDGCTPTPIGQVKAGDVIRIGNGEVIPFDGRIVRGSTNMDTSVLNGRKETVFRNVGDSVSGGAVNRFGFFDMEVESVGVDTAIYRMSRLIDRMNNVGTAVSRTADSLATVSVVSGAVIGLALFLAVGTAAAVGGFAVTSLGLAAAGVAYLAISGKLDWRNAESRFMKVSYAGRAQTF